MNVFADRCAIKYLNEKCALEYDYNCKRSKLCLNVFPPWSIKVYTKVKEFAPEKLMLSFKSRPLSRWGLVNRETNKSPTSLLYLQNSNIHVRKWILHQTQSKLICYPNITIIGLNIGDSQCGQIQSLKVITRAIISS